MSLTCLFLQIFLFAFVQTEKDIVFIIDRSEGITIAEFDMMLDFVISVVSSLDISSSASLVSVLTYSDTVTEVFDLNQHADKQGLTMAIKMIDMQMEKAASRETHLVLKYAQENSFLPSHGGRGSAKRCVILLTHGVSYVPFAIRESSNLKNLPADLYVVGIRKAATDGLEEMEAIASDPDSKYMLTLSSFDGLQKEATELSQKLRMNITEVTAKSIAPRIVERVDPILTVIIVISTLVSTILFMLCVYCVQRVHQYHRKSSLRRDSIDSKTFQLKQTNQALVPETHLHTKTKSAKSKTSRVAKIWPEQLSPISYTNEKYPSRKHSLLQKFIKPKSAVIPKPRKGIDIEYTDLQDVVANSAIEVKAIGENKYQTVERQESFVTNPERASTLPNRVNTKRRQSEIPWNNHFSPRQANMSISSLSPTSSGTGVLFQVVRD